MFKINLMQVSSIAILILGLTFAHSAPCARLVMPPILSQYADTSSLLDINTATAAQLKTVMGIGDAYAARIIAGRPYKAKNQLVSHGIIPAETYEKTKHLIIARQPKTSKP